MSANKGMMSENLIAQMLAAKGKPLRFYETRLSEGEKRKKYEVDFLIGQNGRTTPVEVNSGKAKEHSSLDYFAHKYREETNKPIVLTKGDLRETEDYLYLPFGNGLLLVRSFKSRHILFRGFCHVAFICSI